MIQGSVENFTVTIVKNWNQCSTAGQTNGLILSTCVGDDAIRKLNAPTFFEIIWTLPWTQSPHN